MHLIADAIVLAVRAHGEHGAVARALTPADGVRAGYVRGGRSRRIGPILQPANLIRGEWRARSDEQLPVLTVELLHSRAALFAAPLPAAAIEWLAALTAVALPEAQPFPRLHAALAGVLDAIEAAPAARGWAGASRATNCCCSPNSASALISIAAWRRAGRTISPSSARKAARR